MEDPGSNPGRGKKNCDRAEIFKKQHYWGANLYPSELHSATSPLRHAYLVAMNATL
jgi:hypothetical protein